MRSFLRGARESVRRLVAFAQAKAGASTAPPASLKLSKIGCPRSSSLPRQATHAAAQCPLCSVEPTGSVPRTRSLSDAYQTRHCPPDREEARRHPGRAPRARRRTGRLPGHRKPAGRPQPEGYNARNKAWGFFYGESGAYPFSGWLGEYLTAPATSSASAAKR